MLHNFLKEIKIQLDLNQFSWHNYLDLEIKLSLLKLNSLKYLIFLCIVQTSTLQIYKL